MGGVLGQLFWSKTGQKKCTFLQKSVKFPETHIFSPRVFREKTLLLRNSPEFPAEIGDKKGSKIVKIPEKFVQNVHFFAKLFRNSCHFDTQKISPKIGIAHVYCCVFWKMPHFSRETNLCNFVQFCANCAKKVKKRPQNTPPFFA